MELTRSMPVPEMGGAAAAELEANLTRLARIAGQVFSPSLLDPCYVIGLGAGVAERSADGCRLGSEAWLGLEELRNKTEVFLLVLTVGRLIGVPSTFPLPLVELVRRSYGLGPFRALWAVEGLGHDYGTSFFTHGVPPRGILRGPRTRALPAASLMMLNAGIGMAFAEQGLDELGKDPSFPAVARAAAKIIALTGDNARPGYFGASYESLGLLTRLFFPQLTRSVDRALRQVAPPECVDYFWHGAGRALYFSPFNFMPFSVWQAYETAWREAPDERARLNAYAGITWAFLLVNQRQPEIMAQLLIAPYGRQLARDGGFRNGVASATVMRFGTTPQAPFIRSFCRYRPGEPRLAALWDELVRIPCERALNVYYPALAAANRLGEVFRYHDLPRRVASL